ncbi:class I SAM-dependent methyltransferase [Geodermatophilus sp. SYSU D01180]
MGGCCDPRGCERVFDDRFARRMSTRYREKGLDRTARRMVEVLTGRGVHGATLLETGGGVGEIGLELLRRGAASVTALELSPAYEDQAAALVGEAGLTGRVHRRLADVAADPAGVEPADVVVLHRVVCCYPDHRRLLGAAADHARRDLVFSSPRATRSPGRSCSPRTRPSACAGAASGRSRTRRRQCRPSSPGTACAPPSCTADRCGASGTRPGEHGPGVAYRSRLRAITMRWTWLVPS